jgi:hypothetical protein
MLVRATSERFLPAWGTFRAILASESHWLQPLLVLFVHRWPAPLGMRTEGYDVTLLVRSNNVGEKVIDNT